MTSSSPLLDIDLRADLLLYLDDRDVTAQFDAIAERFYLDTGFMRPGKSMPMEMHGPSDEQRLDEWRRWCGEWKARLIQALENADLADLSDAPTCARHDIKFEAEWVCPSCISENPDLDAASGELREAHAEIRELRAQVEYEREGRG